MSQPGGALLRVNCRGVEKSSLLTLERRKRSEDDDEADSCQAGEGGGGDEEDKRERLMRSIGDVDYEEMATYQVRKKDGVDDGQSLSKFQVSGAGPRFAQVKLANNLSYIFVMFKKFPFSFTINCFEFFHQ